MTKKTTTINRPKIHPMLTASTQYDLIYMFKNKKIEFSCGVNTLNNNWMFWYNYGGMYVAKNKRAIKNLIKGIKNKHNILLDTCTELK